MNVYVSSKALILHTVALVLLCIGFVLGVQPVFAGPTQYQQCEMGGNCAIGEFLYDDAYTPIATASCTLTSRYPDGSLFINSGSMTASSDGWYSYEVVATGSAGLYRSQICCTTDSDYLCLDKSYMVATASSTLTKVDVSDAVWNAKRSSYAAAGTFGESLQNIVPSTAQISEAVWGYSGRTLSGFGSLTSDIWSYSTRSLSSFSTLIASIWSHSDRKLTETQNSDDTTAMKKDVASIKKEVVESRLLLEKVVNKPIIHNFLEEEPTTDLQAKIDESQTTLATLFIDSYSFESKLGVINTKWSGMDDTETGGKMSELGALFNSIENAVKKVTNAWNFEIGDSMLSQVTALKSRLSIVESEYAAQGKTRIVREDVTNLENSISSFISMLGTTTDKPGKTTLYGSLKEVKLQADTLDLQSGEADALLKNWKLFQLAEKQKKANTLADNLAAVNKLPKSIIVTSSITYADGDIEKKLKNRVLSIKGTIEANKTLIARKSGKAFSSSWLEEGSVVFKTLLTNPSGKISQEVPLRYCLPGEIKKEDIIQTDEGLTVKYDVEKKELCVEGTFTLSPSESKVVAVRVQDIWKISEQEIESFRHQADELSRPLKNTAYFGQGVTIKSNIEVMLDKIINNQQSAVTPESKIKTYQEAMIDMQQIKAQMEQLKELVTQAGSMGSLAGFVGGAQAIAVWGLIIIMGAGFVFLVLYMKVLKGQNSIPSEPVKKIIKKQKIKKDSVKPVLIQGSMIRFASIFFILGSVLTGAVGVTVYKSASYLSERKSQINRVEAKNKSDIISPVPTGVESEIKSMVLGASEKKIQTVTVINLMGDLLMVREKPRGNVISQAKSGDTFTLIKEDEGWMQIELKNGKTGYIAKEFALLNP